MLARTLEMLRCTSCGGSFALEDGASSDPVEEGALLCKGCGARAPVVGGIPRFVPPENYAANFGTQWKRFAELQVDRLQNDTRSTDRFFSQSGLRPEALRGMRVLEAGCGGGRFTDVALQAGAEVFAVDLSAAVEKNRDLHPGESRLHLIQASILDIPLQREAFDLVFCFGVLQHTPDPAATFRALLPFVKPGGRLAVDVYAAHPKQTLHWKYALRPLTRRMPPERLLAHIERATPPLLAAARRLRGVPKLGKALSRLVPLKLHDGFMGRYPQEVEERWAILETFDAYAPAYDRPRARRTVERWFERAGFEHVTTWCVANGLNCGYGDRP